MADVVRRGMVRRGVASHGCYGPIGCGKFWRGKADEVGHGGAS